MTALSIGAGALGVAESLFGNKKSAAQAQWEAAYNQQLNNYFAGQNSIDNFNNASLKIARDSNKAGFHRELSDHTRNLQLAQGLNFEQMETLKKKYAVKQFIGHKKGEAADRKAGAGRYRAMLHEKGKREFELEKKFGEEAAIVRLGITRKFLSKTQYEKLPMAFHNTPYPPGPSGLSKLTSALGSGLSMYSGTNELLGDIANAKFTPTGISNWLKGTS